MGYLVWIIVYVIYSLIDISNIVTNIFIIYALRKLGKLGNISYWLICCLSISDCFAGLSGLACDLFCLCFALGQPCHWFKYLSEVRSFFLSYSGRLTTIIAIDRSIRMKFLTRYSSIMTRTKANSVLLLNTVLGLVHLAGTLSSLRWTFDLAYLVFHFICVTSSCIFYLFTYYSMKQQVTKLHLNLQRNHNAPISVSEMHRSVSRYLSKCQRRESDCDVIPTCANQDGGECHSAGNGDTSSRSRVRDIPRHDLTVPDEAPAKSSYDHMEAIPERSIGRDSSKDTITKKSHVTFCNKIHCYDGDQGTVAYGSTGHFKTKVITEDSSEVANCKGSERDAGKAMLVITLVLICCYMPMFIQGFLSLFNLASSHVLGTVAMLLLIVNSSLNAIILTIFSREIRSLAKSLFKICCNHL